MTPSHWRDSAAEMRALSVLGQLLRLYLFQCNHSLEFSAISGLTYNFKNPHTDYQNGIDWHVGSGPVLKRAVSMSVL
jgi:hypothetical protein